jgi:signal transduction histidine kinase
MESITPEVLRSAEDDREDDAVVALARAANAGTAPAPTGAAEPHVDAPRVRATRILAFWLAVALLWCVQGMLMRAVADGPVLPALDDVVGNFVAAGTWAAMTPVVLWLARAVRVTRDRWAAPLAAHAVLCAAVATAQIALADTLLGVPALPRAPILVNPLTQSALAYLSIVAWSHAHDFARRFRERAVAAERLAADLEQTELRARALELHPAFIVAVLQRGAAIVEEEPERVEEALERLADLLRLILDEAHVERGGGTAPTVREELALLEESLDVLALVAGRPIALDEEQLPAEALEARVTAGTLRRVVDLALPRLGQRGEAAPPRLVVEVTAEGTEGVPAVGTEIGSRAWRVTARVVPRPGDPAALPAAAHVA